MTSIRLRKRVKDAEESVKEKRKEKVRVEFFPTGSVTLNMALSGKRKVGWPRGRIINIVGDGSAGKTLLALEAIFNFLKYVITVVSVIYGKVKRVKAIYNNGEGVMDFPLEKMFGKKFVDTVEWRHSRYIEHLGKDIIKEINSMKKGDAVIYVADSWDVFKSLAEAKRFKDACASTDGEVKGSFAQEKNRYAQDLFENIADILESNSKDFTLIIVSQTRDKIGITFGKKKYRTGGAALDFYTHIGAWIREVRKLIKKKLGESRVYGIESEVQVDRSKVWKPFRRSQFKILFDHGLDDIGSMYWFLKNRKIESWNGLSLASEHIFIKTIERKNLEDKLSKHVWEKFNEIEKAFESEVTERKQKRL